jgi:hypothetical protein
MADRGDPSWTAGGEQPSGGQSPFGPSRGSAPSNWSTDHLKGPARTDYLLVAGGGGLLALSTLLPWVSVVLVGSVDLFRLTSLTNSVVVLPWGLVAAGIGLAAAALAGVRLDHLTAGCLITVITAVLFGGGDLVYLIRAVHASDGLASLDIGMYACIAALVLLVVAFVRVHRAAQRSGSTTRRRPGTVTQPVPSDPRPGWKQDPWGLPGRTRYWDGQSWTPHAN